MQLGANGTFEGSFKRAYSFIDNTGTWRLDTGFRIGTLLTEWVSQVQTSPTLIGYIEGAPPVPAENYVHKDEKPTSSVKFANSQYVQYSYGLRTEDQTDVNITASGGLGAEWKVDAGIGVESEVSSGKIKGFVKTVIDITDAQFNNNVSTIKAHTNMDLKMDLTGTWVEEGDVEGVQSVQGESAAKPLVKGLTLANTGLALVESEVADVFALRLKIRGSVAPLIAYQVKPNPDIPKDRNLVAFPINNKYTKQGCLNGRRGMVADEDYISQTNAPKDASYYKPLEAYALKDRIRRAEEQLAGEFERYRITGDKEETHQTMDFVQQEVGGNDNFKAGVGGGFDMEVVAACVLCTAQFDALYSAHTNIMQTKDKQTESGFEVIAELPLPMNIRTQGSGGKLVKRPGAVDAYRWMTFWLEPSVEGTDAFFKQVVDDQWVEESPEPSAILLRQLRDSLNSEPGNARTKAWRLFHRVTYVSRVLEKIQAPDKAAAEAEKKSGAMLADVSCNWLMLQRLEPLIRAAKSRREVKDIAVPEITLRYPSLAADPRLLSQMVELLGDFIGLNV
ncbi:hypothetical protein H2203_009255 [Taxawa tesnikishii (nom. ined.)]|nr:hypothetical protein H2203_009255 [Dothideales sp. JES 119]